MNDRYESSGDGKGGDDEPEPPRRGIDINFNMGDPGGWFFFTVIVVLVYRCNGVGLW